ncbi:MAG TPA: fatty acid cis/trans isomerase [Moraxellaceae bacterium]|nr:fatty acid cis/trans isomerase [Moraxellaceae bacterium]
MRSLLLVLASLCLMATALAEPADTSSPVSFRNTIQPLFEHRCVACHACYDAPCQLNLGSGDGVLRGATQLKVYDGNRTRTQSPTRLFQDAATTGEWRKMGFSSVLDGAEGDSLMGRMLDLGRQQHFTPNGRLPDDVPIGIDATYQCPVTTGDFREFARKVPHRGMPLGVTGLTPAEYSAVTTWLAQGAPVDATALAATPEETRQIDAWEALLNPADARGQLVSRWLYEHLFLAHLYFPGTAGGHFFELVRSHTPPGQPIALIATPQPDSPPGAGPLYYRLRPLQGAIVHKTHITLALTADKRDRIRHDFLGNDWTLDRLPGYAEADRANPFATFAAIPARARYRFMLDNAEYFVRTFIRGPVCRGSIATDVINDQFWVFFQSPESDLYVNDAQFREKATPLLAMPGQKSAMTDLLTQWTRSTRLNNKYNELRGAEYTRLEPQGPALSDIWDGDSHNHDALLTVVRHHDSASVTRGLWGDIPQTMWWLDYPLFEQTYYSLVANFNVFDTVSHQAQTRLFFDLIRHGAEMNFLRLLPPGSREDLINEWYQDSGRIKVWAYYPAADTRTPTSLSFLEADVRREFAAMLTGKLSAVNSPDPINQCPVGNSCFRRNAPLYLHVADNALSRLTHQRGSELPVVMLLPESTLIRVRGPEGQRAVYTLLRNRAHTNVAWMMGESLRFQPEKDRLMVFPGLLTSYPNFAFDVPVTDVSEFTDALLAVKDAKGLESVIGHWGIRRTHPDFWSFLDDVTEWQKEVDPREAGILDINRWENL